MVGFWKARKAARQSEYRARVSVPRPAGTMALPGDAAALRFYEDPDSGACMVHDPHRQTLSVTVAVTHPAYVLLSPGDQQSRVSAWGRLLASLSRSGILRGDPGARGHRARSGHRRGRLVRAPWHPRRRVGRRQLRRTCWRSPRTASSAHRTTITISLDMRRAAKAIREAGRG